MKARVSWNYISSNEHVFTKKLDARVSAPGLFEGENRGCPGLSSWILHSAPLISLKLISNPYTRRPQVINHRRWEQSALHPWHFKKSFLLHSFFCDGASKVARLLFMVNSVWSGSHVLMWQTRDHCSKTYWTLFISSPPQMLSSNRMESTDDFICFELKHSSAGNKKKF